MIQEKLELKFKGPFHQSQILKSNTELNNAGVYIWGFMYAYKENGTRELTYPIDFSNVKEVKYDSEPMVFIPYYVGKAQNTLYERLNKHRNIRCGDAAKYIRLSINYIKEFFMDTSFIPINPTGKKLLKIRSLLNIEKIVYFNDKDILSSLYGDKIIAEGSDKEYPITNQFINNKLMPDPLDELIKGYNNFCYCYAVNEKHSDLQQYAPTDKDLKRTYNSALNNIYESLEAITFWSLKGKTISNVRDLKPEIEQKKCNFSFNGSFINYTVIIEDSNISKVCIDSLFTKNEKNEIVTDNKFPGYFPK